MRATAFLLVCTTLGLSGCGHSASDVNPLRIKIGEKCHVQFRRGDALGAGADIPVSPTTGEHNGAAVQLGGKLASVSAQWIVLTSGPKEYFIPQESVLLIEFEKVIPGNADAPHH